MGRDVGEDQRVAVRRSFRRQLAAEQAARAGAVVDDDLLPELGRRLRWASRRATVSVALPTACGTRILITCFFGNSSFGKPWALAGPAAAANAAASASALRLVIVMIGSSQGCSENFRRRISYAENPATSTRRTGQPCAAVRSPLLRLRTGIGSCVEWMTQFSERARHDEGSSRSHSQPAARYASCRQPMRRTRSASDGPFQRRRQSTG